MSSFFWMTPERFFQICEGCRTKLLATHRREIVRMCARWEEEGRGTRGDTWGLGLEPPLLAAHGWRCSVMEPVTIID